MIFTILYSKTILLFIVITVDNGKKCDMINSNVDRVISFPDSATVSLLPFTCRVPIERFLIKSLVIYDNLDSRTFLPMVVTVLTVSTVHTINTIKTTLTVVTIY